MRDWDWGSIWGGLRWARLGLVVLAGLSGSWFGHARHSRRDPEMAAAVVRAFSEEAGFAMPANYEIRRVPPGSQAFALSPDGRRYPARTVRVGSLAHRLYVDLVAAGADDPGPERGTQETMAALQGAYGQDLRPEDQLAVVPPGWEIRS